MEDLGVKDNREKGTMMIDSRQIDQGDQEEEIDELPIKWEVKENIKNGRKRRVNKCMAELRLRRGRRRTANKYKRGRRMKI